MEPTIKHVRGYFERDIEYSKKMPFEKITEVAEIYFKAYLNSKQFFFIGNGGSLSTASHAYIDFLKGTHVPGKRMLRAVSLTDPSALSALGNDLGFDDVFKYQLEAVLEKGDVVTGISASGNSENILKAIEYANEKGAITIAWLGFGGGKLKEIAQYPLVVPSIKPEYGPAEDLHLKLDHFFVEYLKRKIGQS